MERSRHKIFLYGIAVNFKDQEVFNFFKKKFKSTVKVKLLKQKGRRRLNKGSGFLEVLSRKEAEEIINTETFFFKGRKFFAKEFLDGDALNNYKKDLERRRLFIYNIYARLSNEQLISFFNEIVPIENVYVIEKEKFKNSPRLLANDIEKRYGYVVLRRASDAQILLDIREFRIGSSVAVVKKYDSEKHSNFLGDATKNKVEGDRPPYSRPNRDSPHRRDNENSGFAERRERGYQLYGAPGAPGSSQSQHYRPYSSTQPRGEIIAGDYRGGINPRREHGIYKEQQRRDQNNNQNTSNEFPQYYQQQGGQRGHRGGSTNDIKQKNNNESYQHRRSQRGGQAQYGFSSQNSFGSQNQATYFNTGSQLRNLETEQIVQMSPLQQQHQHDSFGFGYPEGDQQFNQRDTPRSRGSQRRPKKNSISQGMNKEPQGERGHQKGPSQSQQEMVERAGRALRGERGSDLLDLLTPAEKRHPSSCFSQGHQESRFESK